MSEINETIAEVLRLDAQATPGPWDEDGIYTGLRHLGKHCSDWYYRDSDGNLIEVPLERDAPLIAYYRTAAPALAREVQRLQGEVRQAQTGHECALVAAYESGLRAGQKAMRERAAALCREREERHRRGRIRCGPGKKFGKLQVAEDEAFSCASAIRTLEVSHD